MSAPVYDFWTGALLRPDQVDYLANHQRKTRDDELMRQIDCYVEAYRFAWDELGRFDCDEPLTDPARLR